MSLYINSLDTNSIINLYSTNTNIPKILIPSVFTSNVDVYYTPQPSISYVSYQDINTDKDLRKSMTEYFYYKLLDHLKDDFSKLLQYIITVNGSCRLVKTMDEYNKNNTNFDLHKEKFLIQYFITKDKIKHYLKKFVQKHNINWYDLKTKKDKVSEYVYSKVRKDIKRNLF